MTRRRGGGRRPLRRRRRRRRRRRSFRWICGGTGGELQDDDGEGQERERETEADQKEATKKTESNHKTHKCDDLNGKLEGCC